MVNRTAKSTPCLLEHFIDDVSYVEFAAAVGLGLVNKLSIFLLPGIYFIFAIMCMK